MILPEELIQQAKLSRESIDIALGLFVRHEYQKGHYLFHEGEICDQIYYIESGFARFSYMAETGKEVTSWFFPSFSFLTAINSYYNGSPSNDSCVLNENSVVYTISYSQFRMLLDEHLELGKFSIAITFEIARQMNEYINSSKFQTAEERYLELIRRHPLILQKASLGQIATFLGITQETLSRIRAKK